MPEAAETLRDVLMRWAHEASVELNVQDLPHLPESVDLLPGGARIYISHLPKQTFEQSLEACALVKAAGLDPIPHVPVRLLESHEQLLGLVTEASRELAHRIRKRQFSLGRGRYRHFGSLKQIWERALA